MATVPDWAKVGETVERKRDGRRYVVELADLGWIKLRAVDGPRRSVAWIFTENIAKKYRAPEVLA